MMTNDAVRRNRRERSASRSRWPSSIRAAAATTTGRRPSRTARPLERARDLPASCSPPRRDGTVDANVNWNDGNNDVDIYATAGTCANFDVLLQRRLQRHRPLRERDREAGEAHLQRLGRDGVHRVGAQPGPGHGHGHHPPDGPLTVSRAGDRRRAQNRSTTPAVTSPCQMPESAETEQAGPVRQKTAPPESTTV